MGEGRPADPRLLTAQSLAVDRTAAEVIAALRAAGVPSILLKGSSVQRLLYADGVPRRYGDVDVLVAPDRQQDAATVLGRLGYAPARRSPHAETWTHAQDRADVDLHWTLG